MEREIKFKYGYSDGINAFEKSFTLDEIEQGLQFEEISDSPLLKNYKIVYKRQYTESKDKNGVEIYEGDTIKDKFGIIFGVVKYGRYKLSNFTKHDNQHHHIGFYVEKDKFNIQSLEEMCWYINESGNPIKTNNIEVVGNIYENPDLLKG